MTTERDARTHIVLSWLREDAHEDAERLLLRALDEIDTTPQRGRFWPARRSTDMSSFAKLALAAAAVVVVAFAGFQLLPRDGGLGAQPTASPSPTAPPPSPTLEPTLPPVGTGFLEPGRYALNWGGPPTSIEVPSGWRGYTTRVVKRPESTDGRDVSWGGWLTITHVSRDACQTKDDFEPVDGVQSIVDAFDAQLSTDATITDVTIGGHPAKRIDLESSPGIEEVVCENGDRGLLELWREPEGTLLLLPGYTAVVHLLEIDGELVVFYGEVGPKASAADIAEFEAVIASAGISE